MSDGSEESAGQSPDDESDEQSNSETTDSKTTDSEKPDSEKPDSEKSDSEKSDSNESSLFGYPRSAVTADLGGVAAVGVVLLAVYFLLPVATQDRLAFDHGAFVPATLLTAAYVHASLAHLLSNLGGYLSLSVVTYLVCLQSDRRVWFRQTVPLFVVLLPIAINLTSYVILAGRFPYASPVSRGFSGVVAGFGGFLLVAVAVHLRQSYSRETVFFLGQFTILLVLAELYWIYATRISPVEGVAVAGGLTLAIFAIASRAARNDSLGSDHYQQVGFDLLYVSLVFAILVWLVYGLFPADPIAHGTFTNIFAHGAGFVEGGLLAALTFVVFRP